MPGDGVSLPGIRCRRTAGPAFRHARLPHSHEWNTVLTSKSFPGRPFRRKAVLVAVVPAVAALATACGGSGSAEV